ncbi:hypothetical protein ACLKA7_010564 [Drosophila subpalustris]
MTIDFELCKQQDIFKFCQTAKRTRNDTWKQTLGWAQFCRQLSFYGTKVQGSNNNNDNNDDIDNAVNVKMDVAASRAEGLVQDNDDEEDEGDGRKPIMCGHKAAFDLILDTPKHWRMIQYFVVNICVQKVLGIV